MHYYIVARATGKLISRHKTDDSRYKNRRKDPHNMMEYDSEDMLTVGEFYPDVLKGLLDAEIKRHHIEFTMEYLKAKATGDHFLAAAYSYKLHNADPEWVIQEYTARAQQLLDEEATKTAKAAEQRARLAAFDESTQADRNAITFTFPAVRGMQAKKSFYCAQVSYAQLVKMFTFGDEDDSLPAELRIQRELNPRRAVGVCEYILDNPTDYVLPALTASVSAKMWFEPLPGFENFNVGRLHVPMDAVMLINDGQHRRSGIESAIKRRPALKDETIAVVIYFDEGLKRSQQMFSDINCKQLKPSNAISSLFDHRETINVWVKEVMTAVPYLASRTEKEKTTVGAKSIRLWSILSLKKFLCALSGLSEEAIATQLATTAARKDASDFILRFFAALDLHIPHWADMMAGRIPANQVRDDFIIGHAVFLEALGNACQALMRTDQNGNIVWSECDISPLAKLVAIDPARTADVWRHRAVHINGTMNKTAFGVNATASVLRSIMELTPSDEMLKTEQVIKANSN